MRHTPTKWTILLSTFLISFSDISAEAIVFPDKIQRLSMYDSLVSEIERVDAIGIATRNSYKSTNWKTITAAIREEFEQASSWKGLRAAISNLDGGFTNAHSHIRPGPGFPKNTDPDSVTKAKNPSFSYPDLVFSEDG